MANCRRLELHVMASQEAVARHVIGWDAALRELLSYQGGGVWYSSGAYQIHYEDDMLSLKDLKEFTEEKMKDSGITDYYIEEEDCEQFVD